MSLVGALGTVSGLVNFADGSVVLAGPTAGDTSTDFGVLKLRRDGTRDPGFGTNGLAVVRST